MPSTPRTLSTARRASALAIAALTGLALLPAHDATANPSDPTPGSAPATVRGSAADLTIEVLSSAPDHVTGGDARIAVFVPDGVDPASVTVIADGADVSDAFEVSGQRLEGVVDGLPLGPSTIEARADRPGQGVARSRGVARGLAAYRATLEVENHPASGPIFSGPQQQPFVCTTARAGLGQPIPDNFDPGDPIGIPVAAEDEDGDYPRDGRGYPTSGADIIGWSKDCAADTSVQWLARTTSGSWVAWTPGTDLPASTATAAVLDGPDNVPFVVRQEQGTSNRFIYSIATLVDPDDPDTPLWNDRLVFSLQGGVAIGRTQGTTSRSAQLLEHALAKGYAVVNSTGLRTNTHYNLQLGGETALMLKERFIIGYGVPRYTIGVGGSGGAIQQYVYAQNHPGLLDALVPQYSYPDMVTQTIHVGDCELLEYYMDVLDPANPKWREPAYRQALQGLHVTDHPRNWSTSNIDTFDGLAQAYQMLGLPLIDTADDSPLLSGQGECRKGWAGLLPLVMNPTFTNVQDLDKLAQDVSDVEWTHWADLVNIYGVDETGYARVPWDNVGVQYGLRAFVDGLIDADEFVQLNALIGGWVGSSEMVEEGFPFQGSVADVLGGSVRFDPWSSANATQLVGGIRQRTEADVLAIGAAHESGMVFRGDIDIPVIDWRHYLEHELDMHNTHQSFAVRQRMLDAKGEADNLVVWFTDARPQVAFDQTPLAFEVLDEWLLNLEADPSLSVADARPARAVDSCFATDGELLDAGAGVWAGILDDGPAGACTEAFPVYSTSRIEAGASITGDYFKCELKPLGVALADGTYGERATDLSPAHLAALDQVFPTGVCDHARPPIRGG